MKDFKLKMFQISPVVTLISVITVKIPKNINSRFDRSEAENMTGD